MAGKPFPRAAAFGVLKMTGQVGIINEYPQVNPVGTEDREGKTSPITRLDADACEFHILNADGTTKDVLRNVPIAEVRQATVKEIPSKRRATAALHAKYDYEGR